MAYRIYLVDDDKFLLDLYAIKFKNAGHEVGVFGTAEDFLKTLRKDAATPPDAILLDLIMPGLSGFDALETMHKENLISQSKTKIIILSNQGQDSDIEKAKQLGADGYIIKASAIPSEVFDETIRILEKGTTS